MVSGPGITFAPGTAMQHSCREETMLKPARVLLCTLTQLCISNWLKNCLTWPVSTGSSTCYHSDMSLKFSSAGFSVRAPHVTPVTPAVSSEVRELFTAVRLGAPKSKKKITWCHKFWQGRLPAHIQMQATFTVNPIHQQQRDFRTEWKGNTF